MDAGDITLRQYVAAKQILRLDLGYETPSPPRSPKEKSAEVVDAYLKKEADNDDAFLSKRDDACLSKMDDAFLSKMEKI